MRLLMVGPWYETAMRRHIDWALEAGHEVCAADFYSYEVPYQPAVLTIASLLPGSPAWQRRRFAHLNAETTRRVAVIRLQQLIRRFRPDVIHSYLLQPYTEVCLRAGARPLVVSAWGQLSKLMTERHSRSERRWLRRLRSGAAAVLVENPELQALLETWPGPPLPVHCIPLGVDTSVFHPGHRDTAKGWRFMLGIPQDARVVFSPRGWSPIYRQQDILEAFALACRRISEPLVLLFVGLGRMKKPERLAEQVAAHSHALGIADRIRWVERVPHSEMAILYAVADVVVSYPMLDTYPSTVLEALACGCQVISSDLVVYHNTFVRKYCRLVPPQTPVALADMLVDVLKIRDSYLQRETRSKTRLEDTLFAEFSNKQKLLVIYSIVNAVKQPIRESLKNRNLTE